MSVVCVFPLVSAPVSVTLTPSILNPIWPGSEVTLNCSIVLSSVIMVHDVPLLMIEVQLLKDGILVTSVNGSAVVIGMTFVYAAEVISFERNNTGNYTCTSTVKSTLTCKPSLLSDNIKISIGEGPSGTSHSVLES